MMNRRGHSSPDRSPPPHTSHQLKHNQQHLPTRAAPTPRREKNHCTPRNSADMETYDIILISHDPSETVLHIALQMSSK